MRKAIARVLTVISQNQRGALRTAFKNKVRLTTPSAGVEGEFDLTRPAARVLPGKQKAVIVSKRNLLGAEVPAAGPAAEEDARHPQAANKAPGASPLPVAGRRKWQSGALSPQVRPLYVLAPAAASVLAACYLTLSARGRKASVEEAASARS